MNASLRGLYQIEFEQHSATLVKGLQTALSEGISPSLQNELMRAAHSLKGAARLVGLNDVSENAHHLESVIKDLSAGALSSEIVQKLQRAYISLGITVEQLRGESCALASSVQSELLHTHPEQISNLIFLASDLAVTARRMHAEFGSDRGTQAHSLRDFELEIERIYSLAHTLQEAAHDLRLIRLGEITKNLQSIVSATATAGGKKINFRQINSTALVDRQLISVIEPCLIQILKNGVDHGIESPVERVRLGKPEVGVITVTGKQIGANLHIIVSDDGAGINFDSIRRKVVEKGLHTEVEAARLTHDELIEFLFLPGFSTKNQVSEFSGRGFGLDIVRSRLQDIGGSLRLESVEGVSTTFTLMVPSQIASFRSLLFSVGDVVAAVPLAYVERVLSEQEVVLHESEGIPCLNRNGEFLVIVDGESFFSDCEPQKSSANRSYIVLHANGKRRVVSVPKLIGEEETVLKRLDARFAQQTRILGTAIGRDNAIITIINVDALLADPIRKKSGIRNETTHLDAPKSRILIVDDSLTVRELERRILLAAGYQCETAVDGLDGLQKVREQEFDLIVSDIDMPRLNGFEFIRELRKRNSNNSANIPVVVVSYKERPAERSQALAAGANEFLSKGSFKDQSFIATIKRFLDTESGRSE